MTSEGALSEKVGQALMRLIGEPPHARVEIELTSGELQMIMQGLTLLLAVRSAVKS